MPLEPTEEGKMEVQRKFWSWTPGLKVLAQPFFSHVNYLHTRHRAKAPYRQQLLFVNGGYCDCAVTAQSWEGVKSPGVAIYSLVPHNHLYLNCPIYASTSCQLEKVLVERRQFTFSGILPGHGDPCLLAAYRPGTGNEERLTHPPSRLVLLPKG